VPVARTVETFRTTIVTQLVGRDRQVTVPAAQRSRASGQQFKRGVTARTHRVMSLIPAVLIAPTFLASRDTGVESSLASFSLTSPPSISSLPPSYQS
jgi:hypothetical protein